MNEVKVVIAFDGREVELVRRLHPVATQWDARRVLDELVRQAADAAGLPSSEEAAR